MQSPNAISPKDLLIILVIIVIWGMNFVPMVYALEEISPIQLGIGRFLFSSLPFIWFVSRPNFPLRWLFLYAATQGFGQFMLLFIALTVGMPAGIASLLMQVQIFFTAILGVVIFNEVLSRALKISMTLSAIGLSCFIFSVYSPSDSQPIGVLAFVLTITGAGMWSLSNIIIKKINLSGGSYNPMSIVVWSSLISGMLFVFASLVWEGGGIQRKWVSASLNTWLSLLYLGVVANGLGYWVWAKMLARYQVSRVAPFTLGVPVVGMVAGVIILGESVSAMQWLGATLIMSALFFIVAESRSVIKRV